MIIIKYKIWLIKVSLLGFYFWIGVRDFCGELSWIVIMLLGFVLLIEYLLGF